MKIIFCTPGNIAFVDFEQSNLLGTESQIFGIAKELARKGHDVYIIRRWYKGNLKYEKIDGVNIVNIVIYTRNILKYLDKLVFSRHMKFEIQKINPDFLILTEILSSYFVCTLKIPKIYVTHNTPGDLYPDRTFIESRVKRSIERYIFKNCDSIVSLNSKINDYFKMKRYNSVLIPNSIELHRYNLHNIEMNYIMYGGRFDKIKGIKYLLEAYTMLSDDIKNQYKLLLVGDGPDKKNIEDLIRINGITDNVEIIPWLTSRKFIEKVACCSIFVFPSLSETFGIVMIEAMALGKPVIASDIPGPNNIILHGHNGFLFPTGNIIELKQYIDKLARDKYFRCKIGENARKTIEERYTVEITAAQYDELIRTIRG